MSASITNLLPHRPPMQWIDELIEYTDTTATARACFGPGHFALHDTLVSETALVECVAQTVAAALGARAQREVTAGRKSGVAGGMLAAVSDFIINARPLI